MPLPVVMCLYFSHCSIYQYIVFNEGVVLAVVATGAVFIYTPGSFDISLGASTLFSATLGIMAYKATGSLAVMILVIFGVAIGCSLLSSVLASVFHIPVFVTTVAMIPAWFCTMLPDLQYAEAKMHHALENLSKLVWTP